MRHILVTLLVLPGIALAAPIRAVDTTPTGATADGVVSAGEYVAGSRGINAGFGGAFGDKVLAVDSDDAGMVQFGLTGGAFSDFATIYIDSVAGGFPDLNLFLDAADDHRAATSGVGRIGFQRGPITFAPNFLADYAITCGAGLCVVFQLDAGAHVFMGLVNYGTNDFEIGIPGTWIGVTAQGQNFAFVGTYGNPFDGGGYFRSNELHGVAQTTLPVSSPNPGFGVLTLNQGDFSTFKTWCGDPDNDGICEDVDLCFGDDSLGDADNDGVCDVPVVCTGDPSTGDTDGDGVCDDIDLCLGDDALGDADNDGICDLPPTCTGDPATGDSDNDGVCDDQDLCEGDDDTTDADSDGVCNDLDVCLLDDAYGDADASGICDLDLAVPPLRAGVRTQLTVENARPGALVLFFVSTRGLGTGPCAPAGFGSACLDIRSPMEIGRVNADANGHAMVPLRVPPGAPVGSSVRFQAIWGAPGLSEASPVVLGTVAP